jgi:membrane protein DedA with SNARE-associated domain
MFTIIEKIAEWALNLISSTGYAGVFITMAIESAGIPIPSEIVLPFSGFLASTGRFNIYLIVIVATTANLLGSLVFYWIGYFGGTKFLKRYGRYLLVHEPEIYRLEKWLERHGGKVAFFSRMLPGVRTYSSIVIGSGKSKLPTFIGYTILGSVIWNSIWTYLGFYAGSRWDQFAPYMKKFDYLIVAVIIVAVVWFFAKHIHREKS